MKRLQSPFLFFLIFFSFLIYQNFACKKPIALQGETGLKTYFYSKNDTLIAQLQTLDKAIDKADDIKNLQKLFAQARFTYKQTEAISEYYFQGLTKRLNGPVLPDIKVEDGQVLPPHGFQVIEQYLFSPDSIPTQNLKNEIAVLVTDLLFIKKNIQYTAIQAHHFYELTQHQITRIATQGIVGFDTPLSMYALSEAVFSIKSLSEMTYIYNSETPKEFFTQNEKAIQYLQNHTDFNSFDRLAFITEYLMPLSESFKKAIPPQYQAVKGGKPTQSAALKDILEGKSWDADFFTAYQMAHSNEAKIELGEKLFFEKSLSKNGLMSCGSCHQPDKQFTDGLKKANDFVHGGNLSRNTPTIYYAGLQNSQFYDMRSIYLEDQIESVINNKSEFNLNTETIVKKIVQNADYLTLLKKSFPEKDTFNSFDIRNAMAAFVRHQNPFASPFDDYIRGDKTALSQEAILGFNLFMGKSKCGTCHFMPIFNGTIPPWFNKSESEVIGVPMANVFKNAKIDPDLGRYAVNKLEELKYAFKTPTVRNIAQTAPYMHNGIYDNLEDVIEFYHLGGGVGIGIELPNQSLPFDNLILNESEKKALISFMKSLTDKKKYNSTASQ